MSVCVLCAEVPCGTGAPVSLLDAANPARPRASSADGSATEYEFIFRDGVPDRRTTSAGASLATIYDVDENEVVTKKKNEMTKPSISLLMNFRKKFANFGRPFFKMCSDLFVSLAVRCLRSSLPAPPLQRLQAALLCLASP